MRAISRIELEPHSPGIERMRAFFKGHAFTPHRHDSYAVGITTIGVQAFDYRGAARRCLPGEAFVLHPDERHDGRAGDERGFGYRIAYVDPALIREAGDAPALPFLADPVSADAKVGAAILGLLGRPDEPADEIERVCGLVRLADALGEASRGTRSAGKNSLGSGSPDKPRGVDDRAVRAVRELLLATPRARLSMGELERLSGLSRWKLARQFRSAFGVSIHRFQLLRRLDLACVLMRRGDDLAGIAAACGFADQAHLTRQFRGAFGFSPGQWRAAHCLACCTARSARVQ